MKLAGGEIHPVYFNGFILREGNLISLVSLDPTNLFFKYIFAIFQTLQGHGNCRL